MNTGLAGAALVLVGILAAAPAEAKECDFAVPPGGWSAKEKPKCTLPARKREADSLRQRDGFVDLGNGTKVRISGRVQVDVGVKR